MRDAASMVHPLGRSGITEALRAGREAADQAILALADPDEKTRRRRYEAYRRTYRKGWGREHAGTAWIKPMLSRMDDRTWDKLFRKLSAAPGGRHTWTGIFGIAASVLPFALATLRPRTARA